MTHNEKKSLYESIMKDVAKSVKRRLNENWSDIENEMMNLYKSNREDFWKYRFANLCAQTIVRLSEHPSEQDFNYPVALERLKMGIEHLINSTPDVQQKFFQTLKENL